MSNHEAYLRSALSMYRNVELAKRDIMNCIRQYTDLRPVRDTFVFNDGSRKELLCLDGTVPVSYKGHTYNIPVCLWLLDTHPYNPPMAYVKPTSTMQIKPGRHVDNNGRVYLPYLHDWKHPQSDLLGLVQILMIIFGEEPPVFSRGATPARPQQPYTGASASPANPPYPPTGGVPMPMPGMPASTASTGVTGYPPSGYPPTSTPYPSYPGYPPQQPAGQSTPYPAPGAAQTPPYPAPGQYQPPAAFYPAQTQQAQPPAAYPPTSAAPATTQSSSNTGTLPLSDEQIKLSLLSAVEDKMRRRLREIFAQAQAEMDSLQKTQEDLQRGKKTLDDMMAKLEKEQNDVERNTTLLQEKNEEMGAMLSRMENSDEIDIDEAVVPTAPLYKQLLNSFAEQQATEDAIYYLGEGLRKGVVELDVFLKQVRELSRRQFMLRALINKCREKAGLPDISG